MKTTISILILCIALTHSHAQVTTINSGNWTTASTWSTGIVPGAADDVIIRHAVTVSNSSFTATVRNLTIENGTRNAVATLSFNSGTSTRSLHILNNLIIAATSNNNCRLTLQGANTSMDVDGQITLTRNHTGFVDAFGLSLRTGSSVTGNNLTVNYMNSSDDNEEVFIRENSSMILSGDVLLTNTGGAEEPSLDVVDDSYFECQDLSASLALPEAPAGVGRDVEIRVWNNGRMIVHGNLTLSRIGGRRISMTIGNSAPATASVLVEGNMLVEHRNALNEMNKDLPITVIDQCSLAVQGNLTAWSNSARALNFNFSGTSQLDVDGIVTLTGTTNNNLTLNANGNSRLFFGGDIMMNFPSLPNANLFFFSSSSPNISTVTFDGSANQTVPGMETYGNLVINNPSHVTLAGNITVTNNLAMNNGKVKAASRVVTLPLGASITGSSNAYICNGKLSRALTAGGPYWFYVGDTARGYSPVVLSGLSATSTFEVKYFPEYAGSAQSPGPYPVTVKEATLDRVTHLEYWMIDRVGGSGSAQVTLGWNVNSGMSDIFLDKLRVSRWNGSQWTNLGTTTYTGHVSAGLLKTDGAVTSFSPFTFASTEANNFVPLAASSITDFSAQLKNSQVIVNWKSTAKTGEADFTIERSSDGRNFENLTIIPASNNTGEFKAYTITDHHPLPCHAYYRLQQNNRNGSSIHSKIVRTENMVPAQLKLFPNPVIVKSSATIQVVLPECRKEISFLQVFGADGKEKYKIKISAGSPIISLPVAQLRLQTGMYKVVLSYGNEVASAGFIMQ
jgi:hypothetical protein